MKQSHFLLLLLLGVMMSSCTTYQYTSRHTDIHRRSIEPKEQRASIQVNYDKKVTATSGYQPTLKGAIADAEFKCIEEQKIDVVVDPVYRVEFHPYRLTNKYRVTVIGFAGSYKDEPSLLEESKNYTLEDIEKFKLLYDPSFMPFYYQKNLPAGGDIHNYYIKSGAAPAHAPAVAPALQPKNGTSMMLKNEPMRPIEPMDPIKMFKAKKLRNAGCGVMAAGVAVCLGAGLPMLICADDEMVSIVGGLTLISAGAAAGASGIIMASVGGARYNKAKQAQRMDITLNSGKNGLGIGLTF